jgi:hypothetical protein
VAVEASAPSKLFADGHVVLDTQPNAVRERGGVVWDLPSCILADPVGRHLTSLLPSETPRLP